MHEVMEGREQPRGRRLQNENANDTGLVIRGPVATTRGSILPPFP